MPLITVTYSSSRQAPSLKADIAAAVTELTANILRRIQGYRADREIGRCGGLVRRRPSLAEQGRASFWIDVHVSEGTNPRREGRRYRRDLRRMRDLLRPLHRQSYLHVDESAATPMVLAA